MEEYEAIEKTVAFYKDVWMPWAQKVGASTGCSLRNIDVSDSDRGFVSSGFAVLTSSE